MHWLAATVVLGYTAVPCRIEAQARSLGSPVPPGTEVTPSAAGPDAAEPDVPSEAPSSYESVDVPPAPDGSEVRYPVDPNTRRPRAPMTTDAGVRIPSGIATRLRALDSDFQVLAARGGGSIVDGVLSLLTGGLAITIGILLNDYGASGGIGMSPYLYVYGSAGAVRGILDLALMTNPSGPAITFSHMPMTTMDEVQQRLEYGERELASLAERSQISRILDGSLNVAVGLAIIPVYLGPNDFEIVNPFDWFVLIGAGISCVSGIITLVTSTEAERRWAAYRELSERLDAREQESAGSTDREQRGDEARTAFGDDFRRRSGVQVSIGGLRLSGSF